MKVLFLPKFVLITCCIIVIMSGLIYGMILGVITGLFQVAVAASFVIVGCIGIFAGLVRGRITSGMYMIGFSIAWLGGIAVNIMGFIQPTTLSTFDTEYVIGSITISPSYWFFVGGLIFCLVFYTPCLCCAICNCATIGSLVRYRKDKKRRKEKLTKRRQRVKPVNKPIQTQEPVIEELGETKQRRQPQQMNIRNETETTTSSEQNVEIVEDFSSLLDKQSKEE
ncbi:DUF4203 domain-containing protein [Entamoeba marina]